MAKVCEICNKTYNRAEYINKLRGQYNRDGIKIQKPNLQKRKINGKKQLICARCIKAMTKVRKERKRKGDKK